MTEHGKFKEIIDLIGYNNNLKLIWLDLYKNWEWNSGRNADVREIIFTPEFKRKFISYYYRVICKEEFELIATADEIMDEILDNLDDPVFYLYNTLWLWHK